MTVEDSTQAAVRMPLGWSQSALSPRAAKGFRHARRVFLRGERIDMGALAAQLEVNRITPYRWFGRREDLLVRILWSLTEITLHDQGLAVAELGDRRRVPEILSLFVRDILDTPGLLAFLAQEGDLAMRLLTLGEWGYQPALVEYVVGMLSEDVAAGVRSADEPVNDLAFTAVRIVEAYVHTRRITGGEPDSERARRVLHLLLR